MLMAQLRLRQRRCMALAMVLALLTLLAVSGPHLVHHLTEQDASPLASSHSHEGHGHEAAADGAVEEETHHTPAGAEPRPNPPPWPDCQILFLLQHLPAVASALTTLALLLVTVRFTSAVSARLSTSTRQGLHARAPPFPLPLHP